MDEAQRSYHNEQSQLCEKRPVWAFLGIRPGAGPLFHDAVPEVFHHTIVETWSSFPSDHAVLWFAVATTVLLASRRLGVAMLIYSAVLAVGRVYVGAHNPTDVLAGGLLGAGLAAGSLALV